MNHPWKSTKQAILALAAGLPLLMLSGASADAPPGEVSVALKDAIRAEVESKGHAYVGLCREVTDTGAAIGKFCANVISLTSSTADVAYGPFASDALVTATFTFRGGAWTTGDGSGTAPPAPASDLSPALLAAVRGEVESRGKTFLGLCRDVTNTGGTAFGKYCANVISVGASRAEVAFGPYATNDLETAVFVLSDGAWAREAGTVTLPPNSGSAPLGGDDAAAREGLDVGLPTLGLAALAVIAAAGAIVSLAGSARTRGRMEPR